MIMDNFKTHSPSHMFLDFMTLLGISDSWVSAMCACN